jgi:hypothetical protein
LYTLSRPFEHTQPLAQATYGFVWQFPQGGSSFEYTLEAVFAVPGGRARDGKKSLAMNDAIVFNARKPENTSAATSYCKPLVTKSHPEP